MSLDRNGMLKLKQPLEVNLYGTTYFPITEDKDLTFDEGLTLDYTILNKGGTIAYLNDYPLLPGEDYIVTANAGEIADETVVIIFDTGVGLLHVFKRNYKQV